MIDINPVLKGHEYEALIRVARRIARDPHRADDLVHEVWLLAETKGREVARDLPWMIGAMKMIYRQTLRGEARRAARENAVASERAQRSGEPVAISAEFEEVKAAMERLAPNDARAIRQRFLEQRSCRSIAHESGVTVATVRNRIRRGLVRMRDRVSA